MTIKGKSWRDPERITWLLFGAVAVAVYFFALDVPLLGPDEPRYAQVAREMYERGDLVTPTLGGFNWFEKPALLYWLQYLFYLIFGVSEFAARTGSALFGLGTVFVLFLLGRSVESSGFGVQGLPGSDANRFSAGDKDPKQIDSERTYSKPEPLSLKREPAALSNQRSELSPGYSATGMFFALIAATSLGLLVFSRGASFDIIITFPVTASMVGFYIYEKGSGSSVLKRNLALTAFYAFIGVGLIAKGLIGAVFPFAIVTFYYLLARRWPSGHFVIRLPLGFLLIAAVAAFWYLPMFLRHGWDFWNEFFVQHHFQRYTSNKYRHPGPFWYFLVVLPLMTFPWIPFFLASVWKSVRRMVFRGDRRSAHADFTDQHPDLVIFSFAWMLVPLVFFSMSGSKLPGYILPALPPAIVLTALYLRDAAQTARWKAAAIKYVAFLMLASVFAILAFALPWFAEQDSVRSMIREADSRGYRESPILNMHTTSHNAEFYGAGRLVRDRFGRQWRFLGVPGVAEYIDNHGGNPVLVVIPFEFERQLTSSDIVSTEVIAQNGELVLIGVKAKETGETGNDN